MKAYRLQSRKDGYGCFSGRDLDFMKFTELEKILYENMSCGHYPTPSGRRSSNPTAKHFFKEEFYKKHEYILCRMIEEFNKNPNKYGEFELIIINVDMLDVHYHDETQFLADVKEVRYANPSSPHEFNFSNFIGTN